MMRDGCLAKNFPTEFLSLEPAVEMLGNRGQSGKRHLRVKRVYMK